MAIEKIRVNGVDYDLGVSGGSEGSGSGMPDLSYNNPELPNLYYGMLLKGKTKITIDMAKLATWLNDEHTPHYDANNFAGYSFAGTMDNIMVNSSSVNDHSFKILTFNALEFVNKTIDIYVQVGIQVGLKAQIYINGTNRSPYSIYESEYGNGSSTFRDYFTTAGTITIDLSDLLTNLTYEGNNEDYSFNSLDNQLLSSVMEGVNLNTHPIDFITIE